MEQSRAEHFRGERTIQARRRLLLEEAGLGRKAELDEETEFDTTPACASVWIYMRM